MNPRDDSVNIADVKLNQLLKLMYKQYNKRHKTCAQIGSYGFIPMKFVKDNHSVLSELINDQRALSRLDGYTDELMVHTIFNGMVKNNFLVRDRCCYYFTASGYKQALKSSNKFKYLNSYHTATFWGIIIAIVGSPILGWFTLGE
ncbi:hypothetical protein [Vibrio vulnificus]|uniref:hypothetical protein n=1 Tax=Vibrio vulnificus TaxID=672 RepID=UPI001028CA2B|nr:hypothetical protein [Vibrio vulnificus]EGQ8024361.1 hypothetical protein [Vibrio vulnificus]EGR0050555.1 hypothetical protein [Vibrio vulnificus]ELP6989662.1 hypothetical protein [Vibrio vulnificus]RZQ76021.1 hypothetical protein D8T30_06265 [Vibrio vulnificus]RZR01863.1 hypothetical protein D8T29_06135 [Vibrio vulnificus]